MKQIWRIGKHWLARPLTYIFFTLAITAPILFVLGIVLRYGVNVPWLDEWINTAHFVMGYFSGTLRLADLAAPYNSHRLLISNLLMLGLAILTRWDVRYEMLADWFVLLLTWLIGVQLLFISVRANGKFFKPLVIVLALLIFNLMPAYNLIFGFHLAWNLENFFVFLAIGALTKWRGTWKGILIGTFAALCATCSLASGPAIWFVGALGFWVGEKKWQRNQVVFWIVSGLITLTFYFIGYNTGTPQDSLIKLLLALPQPILILQFALTALGAIWGGFAGTNVALLFGSAGLLIATGSIFYLWRIAPARLSGLTPWVQIMLFGFSAAGLIALGRTKEGIEQAVFSNQYVTGTILFWLGVSPIFATALHTMVTQHRIRFAGASSLFVILVFGWGYINSSWSAYNNVVWMNLHFRVGQAALYQYSTATDSDLATLRGGQSIRAIARQLEALRLGPFAEGSGAEIIARLNDAWLQAASQQNLIRSSLHPGSISVAPPTETKQTTEYGDALDLVVKDADGGHFWVDADAFPHSNEIAPSSSRVLEIQSKNASYILLYWDTPAGPNIVTLISSTFENGWKTFRVPVPSNVNSYSINTRYFDTPPVSDSIKIASYATLNFPTLTDADARADLTDPNLWFPSSIHPARIQNDKVIEWSVGDDPFLVYRQPLNLCLGDYSHFYLRMGASVGEAEKRYAQIFLLLDDETEFGSHVITIPLQVDSGINDYFYNLDSLALKANTRLTGVRVDPLAGPSPGSDNLVQLVELRLVKRTESVTSQCQP